VAKDITIKHRSCAQQLIADSIFLGIRLNVLFLDEAKYGLLDVGRSFEP
jgi:hypothetical protein